MKGRGGPAPVSVCGADPRSWWLAWPRWVPCHTDSLLRPGPAEVTEHHGLQTQGAAVQRPPAPLLQHLPRSSRCLIRAAYFMLLCDTASFPSSSHLNTCAVGKILQHVHPLKQSLNGNRHQQERCSVSYLWLSWWKPASGKLWNAFGSAAEQMTRQKTLKVY